MNPGSVLKLLSIIILFVALLMCMPTLLAVHFAERSAFIAFIITLSIMLLFSLIVLFATRRKQIRIGVKDSYLFVTLTWVLITAFGALPLYLTKTMPTFSQCYFEIMSGFTTTGATAIPSIETKAESILFWRNMTNWLGGMGIVVLFVAVLPFFGVRGTALVGAESVGPTKDKLTPKIQHTAMILWGIYVALSVLETVLLLFGGLSLFDAVTVTFGTMGAAGFTVKDASIAGYGSAYVEWVCIVFMILAGGNFALYYKIIQRKLRRVARDGELRLYLSIILASTLLISVNLIAKGVSSGIDALRLALFQSVSFITTTGFSTTDYSMWPLFSQMVLFLLCFVGGCAGSAGGGIKVIRIGVIAKLGKNAMVKRLHPSAVTNIRIGDDVITDDTASSISGFIGLYIMTILIGTLVISLTDVDFIVAFSSVILCQGNIGIGFGGIGTRMTFVSYPDWSMWVFSFLMLVGRLELLTVYSLFTREFWSR